MHKYMRELKKKVKAIVATLDCELVSITVRDRYMTVIVDNFVQKERLEEYDWDKMLDDDGAGDPHEDVLLEMVGGHVESRTVHRTNYTNTQGIYPKIEISSLDEETI